MKWSPRLTVVTPSYNQAPFLEATIRSVLFQGYPNLEYMIVDGGSTDGSVDIIKKYESKLSYWVSERDRGQTHAINKGWSRATGDIVAFLNSDDLYLPGAISASVDFLVANPDVDLMYASIVHIDENGKVFNRIRPGKFALERLIHSSFIPQPTVFMRRSLATEVGPLDEDNKFTMDYDYWLRASRITSPRWLNQFTAAFRYHTTSKSSSDLGHFFAEEVRMFDRNLDETFIEGLDPGQLRMAYLKRLLFISGMRSGCSDKEREAALARIRDFPPPPSTHELTDLIAGHDAFLTSPFTSRISKNSGNPAFGTDGDECLILPALESANLISSETRRSAAVRLKACALGAASLRRATPHRLSVTARALLLLVRFPRVLTYRGFWLRVARAVPFGQVVRTAYDFMHEKPFQAFPRNRRA